MDEKKPDTVESELIAQAKSGRMEAYTELVRRVQVKIYNTIFGMTRNHDDADDLTQDTFMYAYKALGSFRENASFYTWVYRIAVNLTLNALKKKGREKGREDFEDNAAVLEKREYASRSPEGDSLRREFREKLEEAIESLAPAYKAAFTLVVLQEMSHGRAAEILGISENTVSWRMFKARKMLQDKLKPYLDEDSHEM
jgi:RNA polymerase sigma-70 factor (ECF subfamily)